MPRDYLTGWTDEETEHYLDLLYIHPEWVYSDIRGVLYPSDEAPEELVEFIEARSIWEQNRSDDNVFEEVARRARELGIIK